MKFLLQKLKGWADGNDDGILHCNCTVHVLRVRSFRSTMLRGHTFRTMRSSIAFECHQACYNDFRCHSFNYVISEEVCEINNRSNKKRGEIEREAALALVFIEVI